MNSFMEVNLDVIESMIEPAILNNKKYIKFLHKEYDEKYINHVKSLQKRKYFRDLTYKEALFKFKDKKNSIGLTEEDFWNIANEVNEKVNYKFYSSIKEAVLHCKQNNTKLYLSLNNYNYLKKFFDYKEDNYE